MSEIVFILGAGTSVHAGAPVMGNFLDVADSLRRLRRTDRYHDAFERVFSAISQLQVVHSKAELDLDNLESVFGAFEMARLIKAFPGLDPKDRDQLPQSMKFLILHTLEEKVRFPCPNGQVQPPAQYRLFADMLRTLFGKGRSVALITFNYDLALDFALHSAEYQPNYWLDDLQQGGSTVTLLKLHGSLNWGRCQKCKAITPWHLQAYLGKNGFHSDDEKGTMRLDLATKMVAGELSHCGESVLREPEIVPPTWNKTLYSSGFGRVWQRAAFELSEAEHVFVCGYSLSQTDSFFDYLFALGTAGKNRIKNFLVVDPDSRVEERYQRFLGTAVRRRFRFERGDFRRLLSEGHLLTI